MDHSNPDNNVVVVVGDNEEVKNENTSKNMDISNPSDSVVIVVEDTSESKKQTTFAEEVDFHFFFIRVYSLFFLHLQGNHHFFKLISFLSISLQIDLR